MKTGLISIFTFIIAIVTAIPGYACGEPRPEDGQWRKEMRDFKLKFLAQEMDLRQDQQKQFFMLYTQMSDEKEALMKSTSQTVQRVIKLGNGATDADYTAASEALIKAREQELAIDRKYEEKLRSLLTPRQLFKLKEAEKAFRDRLRNMRHNHKKQPDRNRPVKSDK